MKLLVVASHSNSV